jgi:hypothetical protein
MLKIKKKITNGKAISHRALVKWGESYYSGIAG